jgi:hypothetical protein
VDDPHALAAPTGRRLDQQREADRSRPRGSHLVVGVEVVGELGARAPAAPRRRHAPLGLELVAHRGDDVGVGPIQVSPASVTACANAAFSARNPKPGWTASAPARSAASTSASMSR